MEINKIWKKIVTENDTADKAASGTLKVFATPVMIAWMEEASHTLVQKYLDDNGSTVGTEVNIKHLKGSLVGTTLKIASELIEIDRKKLVLKLLFMKKMNWLVKAFTQDLLLIKRNF